MHIDPRNDERKVVRNMVYIALINNMVVGVSRVTKVLNWSALVFVHEQRTNFGTYSRLYAQHLFELPKVAQNERT